MRACVVCVVCACVRVRVRVCTREPVLPHMCSFWSWGNGFWRYFVSTADTATCYRNEDVVGEVLKEAFDTGELSREDVFVTSKLAPKEQGYEEARAAVLSSLERLQLSYIDLYLIHWPGKSV